MTMYGLRKRKFSGHNILHVDFYIDQDARSKNNIWIYWVDFEEDKHNGIYRIKPDGSEKQHIISVSRVCDTLILQTLYFLLSDGNREELNKRDSCGLGC